MPFLTNTKNATRSKLACARADQGARLIIANSSPAKSRDPPHGPKGNTKCNMMLGIQPCEGSALNVDKMNLRLAGGPLTLDSERPAKGGRIARWGFRS